MKITKATFTKGDDGIFYLLPTLYYDKNWKRVCFGFFSIFVEFTFGVKKTALEEYVNLTAKMTILKEAFEKYPDETIENIITHMEKKRNNTVK